MNNPIGGQYGYLPQDMILQKIEQTCMKEDPNVLDKFMRRSLLDISPDKPFLASDEPRRNYKVGRDGNVQWGGGNQSTSRLNLQYSGQGRSTISPHLPDGTFLDFDGLAQDSRSLTPGPNMSKLTDQRKARAKFTKFAPDGPETSLEAGLPPWKVVENRVKMFYPSKDRFKEFETSLEGWATPFKQIPRNLSGADRTRQTQLSDKVAAIQEGSIRNRRDPVILASNNINVGWGSTPDSVFKVAKYGLVLPAKPLSTDDPTKNRLCAENTQRIVDLTMEESNQAMAHMITDFVKLRNVLNEAMPQFKFGESTKQENIKMKQRFTDNLRKLLEKTLMTQHASANQNLDLHGKNTKSKLPQIIEMFGKSHINQHITTFMESVNRAQKDRDMNDLRDKIYESAERYGIYAVSSNKTQRHRSEDDAMGLVRKGVVDQKEVKEAMTTYKYKNVLPTTEDRMNNTDMNHVKGVSKEMWQSKWIQEKNRIVNPGLLAQDMERKDGHSFDGRYTKAMGDKDKIRSQIHRDTEHHDINDQ